MSVKQITGDRIEGVSEAAVQAVAEKLVSAWKEARFCAVGALYKERYGKPEDYSNNYTPDSVFGEANPCI